MLPDLADFLIARIAEDEAVAKATQRDSSYGWSDTAFTEAVELAEGEGAIKEATQHIERWSPARVLAECEAKRQIVAECEFQRREFDRRDTADNWPDQTAALMGDYVLARLAQPYASHPDYRDEWRP